MNLNVMGILWRGSRPSCFSNSTASASRRAISRMLEHSTRPSNASSGLSKLGPKLAPRFLLTARVSSDRSRSTSDTKIRSPSAFSSLARRRAALHVAWHHCWTSRPLAKSCTEQSDDARVRMVASASGAMAKPFSSSPLRIILATFSGLKAWKRTASFTRDFSPWFTFDNMSSISSSYPAKTTTTFFMKSGSVSMATISSTASFMKPPDRLGSYSPYASSMKSTPPSASRKISRALPAACPTKPVEKSDGLTSLNSQLGRRSRDQKSFPMRLATVVFPVPGGPTNL
mmetsp:Transcript_14609/g.55230  ORF Transcript_14609/g.55230 Transcript_14609/m.55230 type:complete len:286 (+) Transcript_14609:1944-2801(+)